MGVLFLEFGETVGEMEGEIERALGEEEIYFISRQCVCYFIVDRPLPLNHPVLHLRNNLRPVAASAKFDVIT